MSRRPRAQERALPVQESVAAPGSRPGEPGPYPRPHLPLDSSTEIAPAISVVIPAYNEEHRLGQTLVEIHDNLRHRGQSFEILVVDDGSTDGTAQVVLDFAARNKGVRLVPCERNQGKGLAVRRGMLSAHGQLILFSDADLSTPIQELDPLLERLKVTNCGIAVGSRAVRGAVLATRQPWYRELAGRSLNLLVRLVAVPGIRDTQCGFKIFRREIAHDLFQNCQEPGFGFDIEILHLARRRGYAVEEVPVQWRHRDGSKVKLGRDSLRMLATLWRIFRNSHRRGGRP